MIENLFALPFVFWCAVILICFGILWGLKNIRSGIGLPVITVLATVFVWYIFDALYNDYNIYSSTFQSETLKTAWFQVVVFLIIFILLTPILHKKLNKKYIKLGSQAYLFYRSGVNNQQFQHGLTVIFWAAMGVWFGLLLGAYYRYGSQYLDYIFPYIGGHPGPWNLSGIGGGAETFYALANYLQLMVGSIFGVVVALSTNKRIRRIAFVGLLLVWPFYIFDRTRKFILVIALPGVLAWVFLRFRGGILRKVGILFICFLFVNAWFGFIIENRSTSSITGALFDSGFDFSKSSKEEHQGLNMFEELAWISEFTTNGVFTPESGSNYIANLVNPIPRGLWPGKPTIGLDYAIIRGAGTADTAAGVAGTLSNGLIGQGVINFGLYFGPAFAALLMGLWAVWLARIDLQGTKIGYLPLFGLGLVLTFTMGRDITFLELYPFVFGYGICWWLNRGTTSNRRA